MKCEINKQNFTEDFAQSILLEKVGALTLYFIMLKNGQTYFKILRCEHRKIFKECSAIFQHYKIKGEICPKKEHFRIFR